MITVTLLDKENTPVYVSDCQAQNILSNTMVLFEELRSLTNNSDEDIDINEAFSAVEESLISAGILQEN